MPVSFKHLKLIIKDPKQPAILFSKWPRDQLYYKVKPLKIDEKRYKCLVHYEDGHEAWSATDDLHLQFTSSITPYKREDDIVCCLCEGDCSQPPNEIILCDVCQQGFHQQCHDPKLEQGDIENTEEWACQTCCYMLEQCRPAIASSTPKVKSKPIKSDDKSSPKRAVLKPKRQQQIKLPKVTSKSVGASQESVKKRSSQPEVVREEIIEETVESVPGDSSDDSNEATVEKLPNGLEVESHNEVARAAAALIETMGTTQDFAEAVAQIELKPRTVTAKIPRKTNAVNKKAVKAPSPA